MLVSRGAFVVAILLCPMLVACGKSAARRESNHSAESGGTPAAGSSGSSQIGGGTSGNSTGGSSTGGTSTGGILTGGAPAGGGGSGGSAATCASPAEGGEAGGTADEPAWPGALDDLAGRIAEAMCEYWTRCDGQGREFFSQVPGGCVAYRSHEVGNDYVEALLLSLQAGRARYDAAAVDDCIARAALAACGEKFDPWCATPDCGDTVDPWCVEGVDGTVPLGGECDRDFDCAGAAYCTGCPGTCAEVAPPEGTVDEGMRCGGSYGACKPGLVCLLMEPQGCQFAPCPPTTGTCVVPPGEGEPCVTSAYGGVCAPGLYCSIDEEGTSLCLPPASMDEACGERRAPCVPGLHCIVRDGELTGTCGERTFVSLGELCDGLGRVCADGNRCALVSTNPRTEYRCAAPSPSLGPCYLSTCPVGEYCPLTNGDLGNGIYTSTCQPAKLAGEPCGGEHAYDECGVGVSRCGPCATCEPVSDIGGPCSDDNSCWTGICVSGVCTLRAACL